MRLRNIPGAREAIADNPYCILEGNPQKGKWNTIFGNDNPIHIEVGMGKGQFLTKMAAVHPDINYIGIERYSSVLLRALERYDLLAALPDDTAVMRESVGLRNIRFICMAQG